MYKHVLIPVVFGDEAGLERSFKAAKVLADVGAQMTVLHVIEEVPAYAALEIPPSVLERSFEDVAAELKKATAGLDGAVAKLERGHAGRGILRFAEQNGVDCIVMQSHKPGLETYFIGSTADRVVRHAKCSVHVIR